MLDPKSPYSSTKSFRTELTFRKPGQALGHTSLILAMGSCFSDSIGKLLARDKFKVLINPLGILYNPVSIHNAIAHFIANEPPLPSSYVESHGIWNNFLCHSSVSAPTRPAAEQNVTDAIGTAHHFLATANTIVITYGSALVRTLKASGEIVANCHKLPGAHFATRTLTPDEIVASFRELHTKLLKRFPSIRIILTVSPVRHIREGLEENNISKSILRLSSDLIQRQFPGVEYFPSYEIMMDDLRDYRFYEPDMIHPSGEAVDYIWEKFAQCYFSVTTRELIDQWRSVSAALGHRPFHPQSEGHQKFLRETMKQLEVLSTALNVEEEIASLRKQLSTL